MEQKQQLKRSKEYIELRERIYAIYFYSYIKFRIGLPPGYNWNKINKKAHKMFRDLNKQIERVLTKWDNLTLNEYGEVFSLYRLKECACIRAGEKFKYTRNKQQLLAECEERLKEVMPRPKRKRITAIKITRR